MRAFRAWTLAGAAGLLLLAAGNAAAHDEGNTNRHRVTQERTRERPGVITHRTRERDHARADTRRTDGHHDRLHRRLHKRVKRGDLRPGQARRIHRRTHDQARMHWHLRHRRG